MCRPPPPWPILHSGAGAALGLERLSALARSPHRSCSDGGVRPLGPSATAVLCLCPLPCHCRARGRGPRNGAGEPEPQSRRPAQVCPPGPSGRAPGTGQSQAKQAACVGFPQGFGPCAVHPRVCLVQERVRMAAWARSGRGSSQWLLARVFLLGSLALSKSLSGPSSVPV